MSRYIDKDEIKRQWEIYGSLDVMDRILADVFPTVDAVPVVHGKWEDEGIEHYSSGDIEDWQSAKCSKCGKWHTTPFMYYFDNYNYCPNCGARMDEVTE